VAVCACADRQRSQIRLGGGI